MTVATPGGVWSSPNLPALPLGPDPSRIWPETCGICWAPFAGPFFFLPSPRLKTTTCHNCRERWEPGKRLTGRCNFFPLFFFFPLLNAKFTARKCPVKWKESRKRRLSSPAPRPPAANAGATALPLWGRGFLFIIAGEPAVKQLAIVIKPPDAGDMAPGYCTFLETAESEGQRALKK